MTIYTSYFYMVRFMRPWEIPLSTAVWDPKWFHKFRGQDYIFCDKNGVLNGVRASLFAPDETCRDLCGGPVDCPTMDPTTCVFLKKYREQLDRLNAPEFVRYMSMVGDTFKDMLKLDRVPDFILLVHEAPNNSCSERRVIQQWFADNNISVQEWQKP